MASITTILGTDSVSSSRIVINNNFNALNTELAQIALILDAQQQTLSLNGEVKSGTLKVNNGSSDTFKVTNSEVISNVESTFNQKVKLNKAIILAIEEGITELPSANSYASATYILTSTAFAGTVLLPAAEDGQEITLIADGGDINFSVANIAGPALLKVLDNGSVTLRYSSVNSLFYVVSSFNCEFE
jgi:hypothetical protein